MVEARPNLLNVPAWLRLGSCQVDFVQSLALNAERRESNFHCGNIRWTLVRLDVLLNV